MALLRRLQLARGVACCRAPGEDVPDPARAFHEPARQEDDDERGAVEGLSGLVLYGVIAAVVGTIGYTGYKIFANRKKAVRTNP